MSCTGTMSCPGSSEKQQTFTSGSPCEFQRKLCVTCEEKGGEVFVRVQTNGMPNHCMNGLVNIPMPMNADWTVQFNPEVN